MRRVLEKGQLAGAVGALRNRDTMFEFHYGGKCRQTQFRYHYHYAYLPQVDGVSEKVRVVRVR